MKLNNRELRTLLAFAEVVVPAGGAVSPAARDVPIANFAQNYVQEIPRQVQLFVRLNLWLIEYCSWVLLYLPFRFSQSTFTQRQLVVEKIRNSRYFFIRGIYTFVSFLILVPYYLDKSVLEHIGYDL